MAPASTPLVVPFCERCPGREGRPSSKLESAASTEQSQAVVDNKARQHTRQIGQLQARLSEFTNERAAHCHNTLGREILGLENGLWVQPDSGTKLHVGMNLSLLTRRRRRANPDSPEAKSFQETPLINILEQSTSNARHLALGMTTIHVRRSYATVVVLAVSRVRGAVHRQSMQASHG
jgi:hypothetical protein